MWLNEDEIKQIENLYLNIFFWIKFKLILFRWNSESTFSLFFLNIFSERYFFKFIFSFSFIYEYRNLQINRIFFLFFLILKKKLEMQTVNKETKFELCQFFRNLVYSHSFFLNYDIYIYLRLIASLELLIFFWIKQYIDYLL